MSVLASAGGGVSLVVSGDDFFRTRIPRPAAGVAARRSSRANAACCTCVTYRCCSSLPICLFRAHSSVLTNCWSDRSRRRHRARRRDSSLPALPPLRSSFLSSSTSSAAATTASPGGSSGGGGGESVARRIVAVALCLPVPTTSTIRVVVESDSPPSTRFSFSN